MTQAKQAAKKISDANRRRGNLDVRVLEFHSRTVAVNDLVTELVQVFQPLPVIFIVVHRTPFRRRLTASEQ
jgi:hypothetical protein